MRQHRIAAKESTLRASPDGRLSRHFVHALSRLRYRYDLDMSLEEYRQLSRDAKAGKGKGACRDELGSLEIWMPFKGRWVCAAFKPGADTISTFLPAPPDFTGVPGLTLAPASAPSVKPVTPAVVVAPAVEAVKETSRIANLRTENARLKATIEEWKKKTQAAHQATLESNRLLQDANARSGRFKRQTTLLRKGCAEAFRLVVARDLVATTRLLTDLANMPVQAEPETWNLGDRA